MCNAEWSRGSSVSIVTTLWLDDLEMCVKFVTGGIEFCLRTVSAAHPVFFPVHIGDIFLWGEAIVGFT